MRHPLDADAEARSAELDRRADELLGVKPYARPFAEKLGCELQHSLAEIADARQADGFETLLADADSDDNIAVDDLLPQERRVYAAQQQRRRLIEQYGCFFRLLKLRTTRHEKLAHVQMWLRNLSKIHDDARDAVAANVDEHLCDLGASYGHRCELLSAVMGCKISTVRTRIVNGNRVLRDAMRQARDTSFVRRPRKRVKSDVQRLLGEINALLPAERYLVAQKLVELAAIGEISAVDKADRASHVTKLAHSILVKLDTLGLNNDTTRRMLASIPPEQQRQWCADEVVAAISGTRKQREAARSRCSPEQSAMILREFMAQLKSKRSSNEQREGATPLSKEAA